MDMSNPAERPDPNQPERLESELLSGLCRKILAHNGALFEDALQRQALSAINAEQMDLKFVDIYTQETAVSTPMDKALAVLLTPTGDWLRPGENTPHYYVYFPFMDSQDGDKVPMPPILNWIEKVEPDGKSTRYTVTTEGIQLSLSSDEIFDGEALSEQVPSLDYRQSKELFEELKSYRLAVLDHFPKNT